MTSKVKPSCNSKKRDQLFNAHYPKSVFLITCNNNFLASVGEDMCIIIWHLPSI